MNFGESSVLLGDMNPFHDAILDKPEGCSSFSYLKLKGVRLISNTTMNHISTNRFFKNKRKQIKCHDTATFGNPGGASDL
jgi:hypothetical protein